MDYPPHESNARPIGVPWIQRDQYRELVALLVDGNQLPESYDEWLLDAEAKFNEIKQDGHSVYKVTVEPHMFESWCRANGIRPTRKAVARFAGAKIEEHFEQ